MFHFYNLMETTKIAFEYPASIAVNCEAWESFRLEKENRKTRPYFKPVDVHRGLVPRC